MMNLDAFGQIRLAALSRRLLVLMDRLFRFNFIWMIQMMCPPTISKAKRSHFSENVSRAVNVACIYVRLRPYILIDGALLDQIKLDKRTCVLTCIWSSVCTDRAHSRKSRWRPAIDFSDQIFLSTNCLEHSQSNTHTYTQSVFVLKIFAYWPTDEELFKLVFFIGHSEWGPKVFCDCSLIDSHSLYCIVLFRILFIMLHIGINVEFYFLLCGQRLSARNKVHNVQWHSGVEIGSSAPIRLSSTI